MTNTEGEALRTELERRLRHDTFTSAATQAELSSYRIIRELLRSRGVRVDPQGVGRNATMAIEVIRTIWPVAGSAFSDSYKGVKRRQPRDTNHALLEDLLYLTPLAAATDEPFVEMDTEPHEGDSPEFGRGDVGAGTSDPPESPQSPSLISGTSAPQNLQRIAGS